MSPECAVSDLDLLSSWLTIRRVMCVTVISVAQHSACHIGGGQEIVMDSVKGNSHMWQRRLVTYPKVMLPFFLTNSR